MDYIKEVTLLGETVGITKEELNVIVYRFNLDSSPLLTKKAAETIYQNPDNYFNWIFYAYRLRRDSEQPIWEYGLELLDKMSIGRIVEVVRCSECVYGRKQSSDKMFRSCSLTDRWEKPNHFCAKGKIEDK